MSTRGGGRVPGRDDRGAVAQGLPSVAIVGVPNVGKSTLFNRLVGRRQALVGHRPGVTRDRIHGEAQLGGRAVSLTDTGGIFAEAGQGMAELVRAQARLAVAEADAILLLVDGRRGLTPGDRDLAALLRTSGTPTILAVNKVDHGDPEPFRAEFFRLGLGDPVAISAEHGVGINELVERLLEPLPEADAKDAVRTPVRAIAIVGRPNVGKSSLLNALGQEQRAIVSDVPGTTRDSIDLVFESEGRHYRIVDTAGIRRVARTPDPIDRLSTHRATDSLQGSSWWPTNGIWRRPGRRRVRSSAPGSRAVFGSPASPLVYSSRRGPAPAWRGFSPPSRRCGRTVRPRSVQAA